MTDEQTDNRPVVTMKDVDRVFYDQRPDGWVLRMRFRKDGETGTIRFGVFDDKAEAQAFFVQLKQHAL